MVLIAVLMFSVISFLMIPIVSWTQGPKLPKRRSVITQTEVRHHPNGYGFGSHDYTGGCKNRYDGSTDTDAYLDLRLQLLGGQVAVPVLLHVAPQLQFETITRNQFIIFQFQATSYWWFQPGFDRVKLHRQTLSISCPGSLLYTKMSFVTVQQGLSFSTFRLNVSAFCGTGGAFRGCLGGLGGVGQGVHSGGVWEV